MTKNQIIQHMVKNIDSMGDVTLQQALNEIRELWESESKDSKTDCKCKKINSKDYFNEQQRIYAISEMLRSRFGFKSVSVGHANGDNRLIEVTYDGIKWKSLEVYSGSPDCETMEFVRCALSNDKWNEVYTIEPATKVIANIIDTYTLSDCGFHLIRNTLYQEDGDGSLDELTGTSNLKGISITFDEDHKDIIDSLVLTTSEGRFTLIYSDAETECKFKPN